MLNVFFLAQIATANASLQSVQGIGSSNYLATSRTHKFRRGANGDTLLSHHGELKREMVGRHLAEASKTYQGALKKHTWGRIALWSVVVTFPIAFLLSLIAQIINKGESGTVDQVVRVASVIHEIGSFILTIFQLIHGTTPFRVIAVLHILNTLVLGILIAAGVLEEKLYTIIAPVLNLFFNSVKVFIPFVRLQGWSKVSFFYN